MLKLICTHPEILHKLALCGHGDKILITDGNYPVDSNTNDNTSKVYLNLTEGFPLVPEVLKVINETICIEKAEVTIPDSDEEPYIYHEFRDIIPEGLALIPLKRFDFYEACRAENIKLAIATGDQRTYANILLTVGVVTSI
jgi:L-fucose mutarotase